MKTLRDYQLKLKNDVYEAWQAGHRNVLAVSPTGSGKTMIWAEMFRELQRPAIAIAHRQELVSQISCAFAERGVYHRIIAPQAIVSFIVGQHIKKFGKSFYHHNAPVGVCGVDTLLRRSDTIIQWLMQCQVWGIDECFPAGTLIDTTNGEVPIESLGVGDYVTSFDERTGEFYQRKILNIMKNFAPDTMFDILINGRHIRCTAGHPFWTKRGWIEAKDLRQDDDLFTNMHGMPGTFHDGKGTPTVPIQEIRESVLFEEMRDDLSGCETQATYEKTAESENLHSLFHASCSDRQDMLEEMRVGSSVFDNDGNQFEICFGKNDPKQSDEIKSDPCESLGNHETNRSQTESSGREWQTTNRSGTSFDRSSDRIGVSLSTSNQNEDGALFRLSDMLQAGHGSSGIENSNRSGRGFAQGSATYRPEERRVFDWHRVDGIKVYKRPDNESYVYNFEVDQFHTYVANGAVVHNCHHVLIGNKWGKAVKLVEHARGVGFTATPERTDRKALGAFAGTGVYHHMVLGPTPRELINRGHLADYRIYGPKASIDRSKIEISKTTGELNEDQARKAAHKSKIVGDIVEGYQKFAMGKLGITFTVDVELANETAAAYMNAGIPAAAVSAKTPDALRTNYIERFERGELWQLVNVDLFGEGFDVPRVEVVSMGRPTASYGLYVQQFGRALRPFPGKTHGFIIDHVDNVTVHKLPDKPRIWSLDAIDRTKVKKTADDAMPVRTCTACKSSYEATTSICPYCGHREIPMGRSLPEQVDGDLTEYGDDLLKALRGEINRNEFCAIPNGISEIAAAGIRNRHGEKMEAQKELRECIAYWAGIQKDIYNRTDSESYRRFYHTYNIDVLTAMTLNRADSVKLAEQIRESWV